MVCARAGACTCPGRGAPTLQCPALGRRRTPWRTRGPFPTLPATIWSRGETAACSSRSPSPEPPLMCSLRLFFVQEARPDLPQYIMLDSLVDVFKCFSPFPVLHKDDPQLHGKVCQREGWMGREVRVPPGRAPGSAAPCLPSMAGALPPRRRSLSWRLWWWACRPRSESSTTGKRCVCVRVCVHVCVSVEGPPVVGQWLCLPWSTRLRGKG